MPGAITLNRQFRTSQLQTLVGEAKDDVDRLTKALAIEQERYGEARDSSQWRSIEVATSNLNQAENALKGLEATLNRHQVWMSKPENVALLARCDELEQQAANSIFADVFADLSPRIEAAVQTLLAIVPEVVAAVAKAAEPSIELQRCLEKAGLRDLLRDRMHPVDHSTGIAATRDVIRRACNQSPVAWHLIRSLGLNP